MAVTTAGYAGSAGTAFTYQGQLKQDGIPVTETCDFEFSMWDSETGDHPSGQVGPTLSFVGPDAVDITNGLFSVALDFGQGVFDGEERFLEIAVRCPPGLDFTVMSPRQLVTTVPHSMFATQTPWYGLMYVPADIADGDDDTRLSEAQVENYITNDPISLAADTTLNGQSISTGPHATDTNASTLCSGAEVFLDGNGNCVSVDATGSSLWHANGVSVYFLTGGVGIGTDDPAARLDITDASSLFTAMSLANTSAGRRMLFQVNGSDLASEGRAGNFEIWGVVPAGSTNVFTASPEGMVGIGDTTPGEKLTVAGRVESTTGGFKFPDGTIQTSAANSESPWNTNGSRVYYNGGNVGIGTSMPGQKLTVTGQVESTSLGFKFPDGTIQTTATKWTPSGSNLWYTTGNVGVGTTSPSVRLDVGGMARINGATWPSTGWGLELAYDSALNRGFVQAYSRLAGAWGSLYLGNGTVGIGSALDYGAAKVVVRNGSGVGIDARGTTWAAHFKDVDNTGEAWIAGTDTLGSQCGVQAEGWDIGGNFVAKTTGTNSGTGVYGFGGWAGGHFRNPSNNWTKVGGPTSKVQGPGAVSFVQNHPEHPSRVIVYTAPEGDEVATYTRGTARLVNGEARVRLGETFKWVTNPDIGLTAHLTPRGDCEGLYVESLTSSEMLVRELRGGTSNVTFDYLVYGLRIGFEETSVVQEKDLEAWIPSMASHRERYEKYPELRKYNALERFRAMRTDLGRNDPLDMSAANALRDAIVEFDPAVHTIERPGMPALEETRRSRGGGQSDQVDEPPPVVDSIRSTTRTEFLKDQQIQDLRDRLEVLESMIARLSAVSEGGAR